MKKEYILYGPEIPNNFPRGITMGRLIYEKLISHGTQTAQVII